MKYILFVAAFALLAVMLLAITVDITTDFRFRRLTKAIPILFTLFIMCWLGLGFFILFPVMVRP